jgi:acyl dehydratase
VPHRAGTHVVIRFEARDQDQNLVFTEYNGGMMRGIHCRDTGEGVKNLPKVPAYNDGNRWRWESKIPIDPMLPFIYDGCTNIVFPIHTSRKFARQVGLPGIILQGTATLALAVRELIHREAAGDPCRLKEIYCRFTGMVLPGSMIKLQVYGTQSGYNAGDLFFDVFNQEDEKVISKGYALIGSGQT